MHNRYDAILFPIDFYGYIISDRLKITGYVYGVTHNEISSKNGVSASTLMHRRQVGFTIAGTPEGPHPWRQRRRTRPPSVIKLSHTAPDRVTRLLHSHSPLLHLRPAPVQTPPVAPLGRPAAPPVPPHHLSVSAVPSGVSAVSSLTSSDAGQDCPEGWWPAGNRAGDSAPPSADSGSSPGSTSWPSAPSS